MAEERDNKRNVLLDGPQLELQGVSKADEHHQRGPLSYTYEADPEVVSCWIENGNLCRRYANGMIVRQRGEPQ